MNASSSTTRTWLLEHMQRVLVDCDGNVSATARRLGIARRTLQLKLKKYPPRHRPGARSVASVAGAG